MSGDKINVRELADMFGMDPQAMKSELQNLGYEIKMVTSSIPAADLDRLKAHFKAVPKAEAATKKAAPAKPAASKAASKEAPAKEAPALAPESPAPASESTDAPAHAEAAPESQTDAKPDSHVERREVQPGLIIRRRRVKDSDEAAKPAAAEAAPVIASDNEQVAAAPADRTDETDLVAEGSEAGKEAKKKAANYQ